jgi:hypothetical protein
VVVVVVAQSHQSPHRHASVCGGQRSSPTAGLPQSSIGRDCCAALADRIEVPNYKSKAELLHYLRIAITMERTGFGID